MSASLRNWFAEVRGQTETFGGSGVCTGITGTGTGAGVYTGTGGRANVFQGQLAGSNSIVFLGVPFDPPGAMAPRVIRITNVRANANALDIGGPNALPARVIEVVSTSGAA